MDYSAANTQLWNIIIQVGILAILLLIANVIRLKIPLVKKALVPTSVIAGFLLLFLRVFNILPIQKVFLEIVTYHGIALGFIAMALRVQKNQDSKNSTKVAVKSGALIVSTYLVQTIVGLVISLVLSFTFMPELFKASGILLAMGYGQGPGQANNVGVTYEKLGFVGGQSYGLAIAAAGFVCACLVGVIYLNILQKKKEITRCEHKEVSGSVTIDSFQDENEIPISRSVDKLSVQVALVLLVYLLSFLMIKLITYLLETYAPSVAQTVSPLLWGFNFIIGTLVAVLVKKILAILRKSKVMNRQYQNDYLLNRISGLAFDLMIISGIASINFSDISKLWVPFILTIVLGGVITFLYLHFMCNRVFKDYPQNAFISMFGMLTGTISSGILLLREVDPEFKTPAANNLITGSGTAIFFAIPVLILIGLAAKSTIMVFIVLAITIVYLLILLIVIFRLNKEK